MTNFEKMEMLQRKNEKIELYNIQKLCQICKKRSHEVGYSDDNCDDDSNDSNDDIDNEKLDVRKFRGNAFELNDADDNYYDHDDDSSSDKTINRI